VLNAAYSWPSVILVIKTKPNSISAPEKCKTKTSDEPKHCTTLPFDSAFGSHKGVDFWKGSRPLPAIEPPLSANPIDTRPVGPQFTLLPKHVVENDRKQQNLGLWSARHRAYDRVNIGVKSWKRRCSCRGMLSGGWSRGAIATPVLWLCTPVWHDVWTRSCRLNNNITSLSIKTLEKFACTVTDDAWSHLKGWKFR